MNDDDRLIREQRQQQLTHAVGACEELDTHEDQSGARLQYGLRAVAKLEIVD
eukprot:CAMPEP_0174734588 /NCGR_PEP_ID=MMETSP1094-20130205/63612_1 /TAXON_ID=156173 /ORGANISM="Chrysochromulina brevifilum, Strain UTEX LB 985" /LENGTH=51 /DNA_ID=CAMNT_0015937429 /DNA_START=261 /DNA_END=413 /DNA_ORIENTATION=+